MTAHPNRNWRRAMHDACADWLSRWRWPDDGVGVLTPEQLRSVLGQSYRDGYEAGRASTARPKAQSIEGAVK